MWTVLCLCVAALSMLMGILSSRVWCEMKALSARLTLVERAQLETRLQQYRIPISEQESHVETVE